MKALILPAGAARELLSFRSVCPDFLLPLVGKPIVEHLVEQLVTCGITDITLLCDHHPDQVVRHFGKGERWGCSLNIVALREGMELQRVLSTALFGIEGMVLCLDSTLVLSQGLEMFIVKAVAEPQCISYPDLPNQVGLCAGDAALFQKIARECRFDTHMTCLEAAHRCEIPVAAIAVDFPIRRIALPADLLAIQREILEERLPGIRIPANKVEEGIWLGSHIILPADYRLLPPVMIGSYTRIGGSGQIGPNVVIGSNCLVNNSDLIQQSIVMHGTAVGPHTELDGLVVRGNTLVSLKTGISVVAPDAFILGDVNQEAERLMPSQLLNALAAFIWLILLAPLGVPLLLVGLLMPSLLWISQNKGNKRVKVLSGVYPQTTFTLREFSIGPLLLRRWPGLVSVITGDLLLAGGLPPKATQESESPLLMEIPFGLFRIWEVEGEAPESYEERIARESFHAVTRTFAGDLWIVLKSAVVVHPPSP